MQFPVIIEKDKHGYYATCPTLSGCSTQGDTYEEALNNIKDAINLYVEDCVKDNEILVASKEISFQVVDLPIDLHKKSNK